MHRHDVFSTAGSFRLVDTGMTMSPTSPSVRGLPLNSPFQPSWFFLEWVRWRLLINFADPWISFCFACSPEKCCEYFSRICLGILTWKRAGIFGVFLFLVSVSWETQHENSSKNSRKFGGKFGRKFGTKFRKIRGTFVLPLFWPNIFEKIYHHGSLTSLVRFQVAIEDFLWASDSDPCTDCLIFTKSILCVHLQHESLRYTFKNKLRRNFWRDVFFFSQNICWYKFGRNLVVVCLRHQCQQSTGLPNKREMFISET